jgi:excisionase family DNA binding protein
MRTSQTHRAAPALLLSVAEAARLLDIGATRAWRLVQSGEIPTVRLGKRVLVPRSAVERIVSGALEH